MSTQAPSQTRTRPTQRQIHDLRCIGHQSPESVSFAEAERLIEAHKAAHPEWIGTATPAMLELLADVGKPMPEDTPFEVAKAAIDAHKEVDPAYFERRRQEARERRRAAAPPQNERIPGGKLGEYLLAARGRYANDPEREPASKDAIKYAMDLAFERPTGDQLRIDTFSELKKGASSAKVHVLIKKLRGEFVERRAAA
jgi:hypothetical protein